MEKYTQIIDNKEVQLSVQLKERITAMIRHYQEEGQCTETAENWAKAMKIGLVSYHAKSCHLQFDVEICFRLLNKYGRWDLPRSHPSQSLV